MYIYTYIWPRRCLPPRSPFLLPVAGLEVLVDGPGVPLVLSAQLLSVNVQDFKVYV